MTTEVALSAAPLAVETAKTTVFAYWLRRWKRFDDQRLAEQDSCKNSVFAYWLRRWKRFDDQRLAERRQQFEAAQARSATLVPCQTPPTHTPLQPQTQATRVAVNAVAHHPRKHQPEPTPACRPLMKPQPSSGRRPHDSEVRLRRDPDFKSWRTASSPPIGPAHTPRASLNGKIPLRDAPGAQAGGAAPPGAPTVIKGVAVLRPLASIRAHSLRTPKPTARG